MAVFTGNGSAAAPSITFSSDTNTGIFRSSSDELSITTGGTNRVVFGDLVDLSGGGNTSLANFQNTRIGLNVNTATSVSAAPVDFREDVGAGTAQILSLTNSNGTFGTGLGAGLNFGAFAGTVVATISGAMAGPAFSNGGILTLETSSGFLGHMKAVVNGGEVARIGPAGDLLIGGTLPSAPNITLNANGNATFAGVTVNSLIGGQVFNFTPDSTWQTITGLSSVFTAAAWLVIGNFSKPGNHSQSIALATMAFGAGQTSILLESSHQNIAAAKIEYRWDPVTLNSSQSLQVRTAGNNPGAFDLSQVRLIRLR
jgi:hypothetical protein